MRLASIFVAASLLAGCASYGGFGLRPGVDDQARVRAVMGAPSLEFRNPDGTSTWAYPRGPLGYHTFMVRFSGAGLLAGTESVLDPDHFARVVPGLNQDDVRRIVGPPGVTEAFPRNNELAWDYRFVDAWGYPSNFSVIFDGQGRVKRTLIWRERVDDSP
jgi:SmpA/OmlA family protein